LGWKVAQNEYCPKAVACVIDSLSLSTKFLPDFMTLQTLDTGFFKLDGGTVFGVVPKVLWQQLNPPDEQNRCTGNVGGERTI
jgi:hypothetical protein